MILDLNLTWKSSGELVWQVSPQWDMRRQQHLKICVNTFSMLTGKKFTEALRYYSNSPCLKIVYFANLQQTSNLHLGHIPLCDNCFCLLMNIILPATRYL